MAQFKRMQVGSSPYAFYDTIVVDRYSGELVFASIIGYQTVIDFITSEVNNYNNVYIEGTGYIRTSPKNYLIEKRKQSDSEFTHSVIFKKDKVSENGERLISYLFYKNEEEQIDRLFDKIYKNTPVPILKEWMPYIASQLRNRRNIKNCLVLYDNSDKQERPFYCDVLDITISDLQTIVSGGLATGLININGSNNASNTMYDISGLDSYLNSFSEVLALKIQESFVPKFIPGESDYLERTEDFDDSCYEAGIEIFEAQKSVIQASVNNLNKSKVSLVVGEMGSGKTLIGAGITYAHAKKDGYTAVIMCPSHLTNKWKREIERLVPNGKAIIVKHIKEIQNLDKDIRNKNKKNNLFLIVSKETAKFGYEMKPAVVWSTHHKTFVCPECGKPLTKKVFVGEGRSRFAEFVKFDKRDMSRPLAYNHVCENTVSYWDKEKGIWEERTCGNKLWAPLNKEDEDDSTWIKLGKHGWIMINHINDIFNNLISQSNLTRNDTAFLSKLSEKKAELDRTGEVTTIKRAPRKYPIAKYIKKFYSGTIDYLLGDELELWLLTQ